MRQKIVIMVSMHCEKCWAKAMKIVAAMPGVESVALAGQEKNQLEVIGDGIDPVKLTTRLRKKVGHADILTVAEAKVDPSPAGASSGGGSGGAKPLVQQVGYYPPPPPTYYYYDARQPFSGDGGCTIM